jgi:hypothetical protein
MLRKLAKSIQSYVPTLQILFLSRLFNLADISTGEILHTLKNFTNIIHFNQITYGCPHIKRLRRRLDWPTRYSFRHNRSLSALFEDKKINISNLKKMLFRYCNLDVGNKLSS